MKSLISILSVVITALLIYGGFMMVDPAANNRNNSQTLFDPCIQPITYKVGAIDQRYQITNGELITIMAEVTSLWNEAVQGTIIEYEANGQIDINLVFTEDQHITESERQYRDRLTSKRNLIDVLEREYEQKNRRFEEMSRQYQQDSDRLQRDINELNRWVNTMNEEHGGFMQSDLEEFERRKQEIDQRTAEMNRRAADVQTRAQEINRMVEQLNQKIDEKNVLIHEYNQRFAGTRRFTQGTYEWVGDQRRINVFQFSDRDELKLVLAHEVGHALGMDHVENPESIMYHLMGQQSRDQLQLSPEDIRALQQLCN